MSEYQLKTGKIGKAVTGAYKKVEDAFVETFLEKPEDGEGTGSLKTGKVGEAVVGAYKAIEEAAVNGYKNVNANQKMSFIAGIECHFLAVSIRWICSLDYLLLVGLKPVKP